MYYKELGDGMPVVMIHGFMENGKMWEDFATDLAKDYHVIIPDLLGHGKTKSIAETHTMEMQAEQIIEILDKLNIKKAAFIGHSMGGYISMAIARDFHDRVEKLCLFFSTTQPDSSDKKEQRLKAIETVVNYRESFIKHGVRGLFYSKNLPQLAKELEKAKQWAYETPNDGIIASLKGMRLREDTTFILNEKDYPVQIILGKHDTAVDSFEFKNLVPNKSNIKVDVLDVAHMGHLEAPEESLLIIKNFLGRNQNKI